MKLSRYGAFGVAAAASLVTAAPAWAAEEAASPGAPVTLTDAQLDDVVAGESLVNLDLNVGVVIQPINVNVDVNIPIDVGVIVQANVMGTAMQTAQQFFPAGG
jgi:CRISPR/Cas system-associated exonuclease Cas4 (RecB family)